MKAAPPGVENACHLPPEELDPVRVGNCVVTVSLLADVSASRLLAAQAQVAPARVTAVAALPLEFANKKSKSQRKTRRGKKAGRAWQEAAAAELQQAQQQPQLAEARLGQADAEQPLAFAAALAGGEAALRALLSPASLEAGAAALRQLLPAAGKLFALHSPCGPLQRNETRFELEATAAAQPSAPEDFSLRARSTGLLPALPDAASSHHTRWPADSSPVAESAVAEASPLEPAAEALAPAEASAIAADVARHTVGAGAAHAPEQLQIAAALAAEAAPAEGGERLDSYEAMRQANLQRYWQQRYSLWSRFDEGVLMDREGWYSVTPEALAAHQAERLACDVAVDAFCGVGGNAVQLARTCGAVLACDTSPERLLLAAHNARVYGVAARIDFVCADFLRLSPRLQADAVFMSPPWGGPGYNPMRGTFDAAGDFGGLGVGYAELLRVADAALHRPILAPREPAAAAVAPDGGRLATFLPKSTSLAQLGAALPRGMGCEVERNVLNGRLKSVTVYVGEPDRRPRAQTLPQMAAFAAHMDDIAPE